MNNYEEVNDMPIGTIFRLEEGAPWMRASEGVKDLLPVLIHFKPYSIPNIWKTYNYPVNVLYSPSEEE